MTKLTSIDTDLTPSGSDILDHEQSGAAVAPSNEELKAMKKFGLDGPLAGRPIVLNHEELAESHVFVTGATKDAKIAISAYKNLRTRLLLRMKEVAASSVLVCGATQNVGKTLTSINLALALARRSAKQVILVDMDLRSPSVHHVLGFKSTGCILDVAEGRKSINEVLVDPGVDNLLIVPGSDRHEDSSEALVSIEMQQLIKALRAREDTIVVFDTPPVLGCDDVVAVSPYMETVLFVVSEKSTSKKELSDSLSMLSEIEVLGITVNRSSEGNFSAYYY